MATRILVVDDDAALAEMIGIVLEQGGYEVSFCYNGSDAVTTFLKLNPALVLLDVMLPGVDGYQIAKVLKANYNIPIIMLTAKSDSFDIVKGLESGADDYIIKPFDPNELLARIKVRLRGFTPMAGVADIIEVEDITINLSSRDALRAGERIPLSQLEFSLLATLASNPSHSFSRQELLNLVWGHTETSDPRVVNVHVQRLRAKVENDPDSPKIVRTVRGIGYRAGKTRTLSSR